jgi:hypothetical protein
LSKKKLIFIVMVVMALVLAVPLVSQAQSPEKNYSEEAIKAYGNTGTYTADPYTAPVVFAVNFNNIDDVYTYKLKATSASMIDVHVTDCCVPGDWFRANIVRVKYTTTIVGVEASSTHSTQTAAGTPGPDDPTWSPAAIVRASPKATITAIVTIAAANNCPAGLPAGMWVKFTTDGSALTITPIPQKGIAQKYALLICGDTPYTAYKAYTEGKGAWSGNLKREAGDTAVREGSAEYGTSFEEFWDDTARMYKILVNKCGFDPANVIVLWGDGTDWAISHRSEVCNAYDTTGAPIVDGAATIGNVQINCGYLASVMTTNDSLFVWTFDHGATGLGADGVKTGDSQLCLMDGNITDVQFASYLNAIPYQRRTIFMQQCFSGGFIDNLTITGHNGKTAIYTACQGNESAWRADNLSPDGGDAYENEACQNYLGTWLTASHGEFNYHFMNALEWKTPYGTAVNADSNPLSAGATGDGSCSSFEAFNFAKTRESYTIEHPQYKDYNKVGWSWIVTNK